MSIFRNLLKFILSGIAGVLLTLISVYIWYLQSRPELNLWHTAKLSAEFRAGDAEKIKSLDDYLRIEDKVFKQLKNLVYDKTDNNVKDMLNRYRSGSLSDPTSYSVNLNRTREIVPAETKGGVVLIHGLSDSPYAMRALGERMAASGYHIVILRLPGHGTAPSGLVNIKWEDWAAAVRIAARHVRNKIGTGKPLYLAGYSTGAALSVEYSLAALQGESLPEINGLILISPAIGVSPVAFLAKWQSKLSIITGMNKVAWESILPEYDPYKYGSFAVNAGDQIYRLTRIIDERISALSNNGSGVSLPPILAFQSVADATVSTDALAGVLFTRLSPGRHHLVLFDINRHAKIEFLLKPEAKIPADRLLSEEVLPFEFVLLTNRDTGTMELVKKRRPAGTSKVFTDAAGMKWPEGIYSLSHLALTFPEDDPVYGIVAPDIPGQVYLGHRMILGEKGLSAVSITDMMRLHYNPFFPYMYSTIVKFLDLNAEKPVLNNNP